MPSFTAVPNQQLPAVVFNRFAMAPVMADVTAEQSTTSNTYTDLSTAGPSQTLTLTVNQVVEVEVCAYGFSNGSGNIFYASFVVSGATSLAATDANASRWREGTAGGSVYPMISRTTVVTATGTGATTFKMVYRSDGTNIGNWGNRRIIVRPKL